MTTCLDNIQRIAQAMKKLDLYDGDGRIHFGAWAQSLDHFPEPLLKSQYGLTEGNEAERVRLAVMMRDQGCLTFEGIGKRLGVSGSHARTLYLKGTHPHS